MLLLLKQLACLLLKSAVIVYIFCVISAFLTIPTLSLSSIFIVYCIFCKIFHFEIDHYEFLHISYSLLHLCSFLCFNKLSVTLSVIVQSRNILDSNGSGFMVSNIFSRILCLGQTNGLFPLRD